MVTRYGMDDNLGMVSLGSERSTFLPMPGEYLATRRDFSEQTASEVDCAVRDLVTEAFERAVEILEAHRNSLAESAERLLVKETLLGDELPVLIGEPGEQIATGADPTREASDDPAESRLEAADLKQQAARKTKGWPFADDRHSRLRAIRYFRKSIYQ